jgi:hypothetical protein
MPISSCYDVHGLVVQVNSTCGDVAAAVASRLRPFAVPPTASDLRVSVFVGGPPPVDLDRMPWGQGRLVYESEAGQILFVENEDLLLLDSAGGRAWARAGAGEVTMYAARAGGPSTWLLSHPFLTIPLMEMLKRRSVFSVHAGAVADHDRALLLAGPSGAGKTTLTVALARCGLSFLGDDLTFVAATEAVGRLLLLPFADEIDLLDDATYHFPELQSALAEHRPPGWPKHPLRIEDVLDVRLAGVSTPVAGVLLGERAETVAPRLEAVSAEVALLELAPNVLLTDPTSSQAHLDALGYLTRACQWYVLHAGSDLDLTAAAVASVLN